MTLIVPENYAQVIHSLKWANDPEPMAVTYGVFTSGSYSPATVATECRQAFANLMAEISIEIDLVNTEVRLQASPLPDPPVIGTDSTVVHGAASGTVVPQNTAYLLHKRTAVGGRTGRGRMYIPGVGESVVDNTGNVSSGKVTGINTAAAAFLAALVSASHVDGMVLLHDDGGAGATLDPFLVSALTCDPVVATQRRRLRR